MTTSEKDGGNAKGAGRWSERKKRMKKRKYRRGNDGKMGGMKEGRLMKGRLK